MKIDPSNACNGSIGEDGLCDALHIQYTPPSNNMPKKQCRHQYNPTYRSKCMRKKKNLHIHNFLSCLIVRKGK